MDERSVLHDGSNLGRRGTAKSARVRGVATLVASLLLAAGSVLPAVANAGDALVCQELKAAVADAQRGFAAYKGALVKTGEASDALGQTYGARQSLTGAKACHVVEVNLNEPKMRLRRTGYRCQFPAVRKFDAALRAELKRCVSGEVDDPLDTHDQKSRASPSL
jgi:hypothetical protein